MKKITKQSLFALALLAGVVVPNRGMTSEKVAEPDKKFDGALDKPLLDAAMRGNVDRARDLLKKHANPNAQDAYGETALMKASYWGHAEMVKILLDERAGVNAQDCCGNTALMFASAWDHTSVNVIMLLLTHDANATLQDYDGNTVIDSVRKNRQADIMRILVAAIGVADEWPDCPLDVIEHEIMPFV
jgi:uncharacterized protein